MRCEQATAAPLLRGADVDAKFLRELIWCQQSRAAQTIIATGDLVSAANLCHRSSAEETSLSRVQSLFAKLVGDLSLGELIEQSIDGFENLRNRLAKLPGAQRPRQVQHFYQAPLESHVCGELSGVEGRDIFDQQSDDALAISIRRARIVPEFGKVRRQFQGFRAC